MSDNKLTALINALSAYGIKLQAALTGTPTPTPTRQESADNTIVMSGSSATIIDRSLNSWQLASNGYVLNNGKRAGNSANAVELMLLNDVVWHRNKSNNWYEWDGTAWKQGAPIGGSILAGSGPTSGSPPAPASIPTPTTVSTPAQSLITYFNTIKGKGCLSGQFVERGSDLSAWNAIYTTTGKAPAVMGFDCWWANAPFMTKADNSWTMPALDHALLGGVVTLNVSMPNPASGGGQGDLSPVDFDKLVTPGNAINSNFVSMLDDIAFGLSVLQQHGQPVIFRPFHENNGSWDWWGVQACSDAQFCAAWIYMHKYLTNTKGLDNLIWLNAQNAGGARLNRIATSFVDMVGIDGYTNNPAGLVDDIKEVAALGLPVALSEFGSGGPGAGDTSYKLTDLVTALKGPLSDVVYWLNWWDGNSGGPGWGMGEEQSVKEALNDPFVINRGDAHF